MDTTEARTGITGCDAVGNGRPVLLTGREIAGELVREGRSAVIGAAAMEGAAAALSAGEAMRALQMLEVAAVEVEVTTRRAVDLALAQGARWDDIAAALRLGSRQAAYYRYGRHRTTETTETTETDRAGEQQ